jgi:hypothetical protein
MTAKISSPPQVLSVLANLQDNFVGCWLQPYPLTGSLKYMRKVTLIHGSSSVDAEIYGKDLNCIWVEGATKLTDLLESKEFSDIAEDKSKLLAYKLGSMADLKVRELRLTMLQTNFAFRTRFEEKKSFNKEVFDAQCSRIESEIFKKISKEKFKNWQKKWGEKLVIQKLHGIFGAGTGTCFCSTLKEYQEFVEGESEQEYKVAPFVEGESVSVVGVITDKGCLFSFPQEQLIDVVEVLPGHDFGGVFCGHQWGGLELDEALRSTVFAECLKFAEHMRLAGYRGIFGLDLIVNLEKSLIYIIECNARYTAAFPMISMLQERAELVPFEAIHIGQYLGLDIDLDWKRERKNYFKPLGGGSQLILRSPRGKCLKVCGEVVPGIYCFDFEKKEVRYKKRSLDLRDIVDPKSEFILTDGVLRRDDICDGSKKMGRRMCRLLFRRNIYKKKLLPEVSWLVSEIYGKFSLTNQEAVS